MPAAPVLLKVSPQGQVTLRRAMRAALKHPRHFEARIENGALVLRPALAASPAEAEALFGTQAITREVLVEALRVVRDRRARKAES
jgi:hypothetical protein